MSKFVGAVLLDTRSIQKYVFYSNELKTNVGASYIVDKIFSGVMCKDILGKFGFKKFVSDWKRNSDLLMKTQSDVDCEIAYIGGGNMLVLVNQNDLEISLQSCREIVKRWSKFLLIKYPGLKVGCAVAGMDIEDDKNFKRDLNLLYQQLKRNQNTLLPVVDLPYTGLTYECPVSGKTAEIELNSQKHERISFEVQSKLDAYKESKGILLAEEENKDNLIFVNRNKILNKAGEKYIYAEDLNMIGNATGESYISVIHIDGNNMGVKFAGFNNMQERKYFSLKVAEEVNIAFNSLLDIITEEYHTYGEKGLNLSNMECNGARYLPVRPIIIGGDDVTFICAGRMGLLYAKQYMEKIAQDGMFSCCAGVAIVPSKYPFFRAYQLAEQLCSAAKSKARDPKVMDKDNNWLDFAILHGEMSAELDVLRKEQYTNPIGYNLHFGPYRVGGDKEDIHSIEKLLELTSKLIYKSTHDSASQYKMLLSDEKQYAARNKIKKLRDVLLEDEHRMNVYLDNATDLKSIIREEVGQEDYLPSAKDLWCNDKGAGKVTRYMDAIEIIDFLPKNFHMGE